MATTYANHRAQAHAHNHMLRYRTDLAADDLELERREVVLGVEHELRVGTGGGLALLEEGTQRLHISLGAAEVREIKAAELARHESGSNHGRVPLDHLEEPLALRHNLRH